MLARQASAGNVVSLSQGWFAVELTYGAREADLAGSNSHATL
jgi:hypothetical protein